MKGNPGFPPVLWAASCWLFISGIPARGADPVSLLPSGVTPSLTAAGASTTPILSADGHWIVFTSEANNLVTNDTNDLLLDVFARNLANGVMTLASVTPEGRGSGNGSSLAAGISSNGQFVVFESRAGNLVANDTNQVSDVFVRDLVNGTTLLVSVNKAGTASGSGASSNPVMTPDGRFVAFESTASDLVANDTNRMSDVFVRDLVPGTTALVSVRSNGMFSANGDSTRPAISDDGQVVAFASMALNLARAGYGVTNDLYVRDLAAGVTRMIDVAHAGVLTSTKLHVFSHVLSADGHYLAFLQDASNTNATTGVRAGVYWSDLVAATNLAVATNLITANGTGRPTLAGPVMSADGQVIAFEGKAAATNTVAAVYAWDARSGTVELVSTNAVAQGSGSVPFGTTPALSADGARLAFLSLATSEPPEPNDTRLQLFVRDRASGATQRVSTDRGGHPAADAEFPAVSCSADGHLLAWQSRDDNLAAGDLNRMYDVFVRDLELESTTLVSARADTLPSLTDLGAGSIASGCISADGRYVVFVSDGPNLTSNDTNGVADVFVRDRVTGSHILVSVNLDGKSTGNGMSRDPVISASGNYVAFVSAATDLVANDSNQLDDVFVRDLQAGTTRLVSINKDRTSSAAGTSSRPCVSADGKRVAFQSKAADLVENDGNGQPDVFLFDVSTGSNRLASADFIGTGSGAGASEAPVLTADGRRVVFQSRATDLLATPVSTTAYQVYARDLVAGTTLPVSRSLSLVTGAAVVWPLAVSGDGNRVAFSVAQGTNLYLCDLLADVTATNTPVATDATAPSLSADGRWVAFQQITESSPKTQVFVKDLQSGSTVLASVNGTGTGGGNGHSTAPIISGDGRYVVFKSQATDLVGNDTNTWSDIFVRDLLTGTTLLASVNRSGSGGGDQLSSNPILGPDGRTVLFQSFASDLTSGDFNHDRDVFVVRLGTTDADNDGMPDDWEVTWFGNLARDGLGDADGDGLTDLAEYRAGTTPINDASVLRVISIQSVATGETTIVWSAVPGKAYGVQYKDDLGNAWSGLATGVTLGGDQAWALDPTVSPASQRFYRVVALP